jgi:hypothetical protein
LPLGPPGGDLDLRRGDRARGARSRSNGDLDRLRSSRLGVLALSLRSSKRRGLLGRGDLALDLQFIESRGGVLSLRYGGVLDLRRSPEA